MVSELAGQRSAAGRPPASVPLLAEFVGDSVGIAGDEIRPQASGVSGLLAEGTDGKQGSPGERSERTAAAQPTLCRLLRFGSSPGPLDAPRRRGA